MNFGPHHVYFTGKNNNFYLAFYLHAQRLRLLACSATWAHSLVWQSLARSTPRLQATDQPLCYRPCCAAGAASATGVLLQTQGGEHMSECKRLLDSLSRTWNTEWAVLSPATYQQIEFQARSKPASNRFSFFIYFSTFLYMFHQTFIHCPDII